MILQPLFAETDSVPLSAESILNIGSFEVTNSMIMGILMIVIISSVFVIAAKRAKVRGSPRFSFFIENVVGFILTTLKSNFGGDEKKARKFLPLFLAFFVFILLNNLFGLLPGMGVAYTLRPKALEQPYYDHLQLI